MRTLRKFEDFIKQGVIKKKHPDKDRAKSLIEESDRKFKSMKKILNKVGLDNENSNDIIESCYDILTYLIRAKMLSNGFSSSGNGAHEAEVSYLRTLKFPEVEVEFMNKLRYFRNGIMYYGERFDKEYAEKVIKFLKKNRERLNNILNIKE